EQPVSTGTGEAKPVSEETALRHDGSVPTSAGTAGPAPEQVAGKDTLQLEADEQVAKPEGKAYELEVEKKAQPASAARKAVSFMAVSAALGLLALFIKGYFAGRR
ncbi:MAG: hypothetical protein ACPL5F_14350, partial [Moorellaceae bacterium]